MSRHREKSSAPGTPPAKLRKTEPLAKLSQSPTNGRFDFNNYWNKAIDARGPAPVYQGITQYMNSNFGWIWKYLEYVGGHKEKFRNYIDNFSNNGIYDISPADGASAINISVFGDWATGTKEAWHVADYIEQAKPDFTVHLGDVYYVGDQAEIEQNCFGQAKNGYDGVNFPMGKRGSFALNGNHEMYANGVSYFKFLLPRLGMKGSAGGQEASYFCLEAEHWRIIAIDTGYNSLGMPILGVIPGLNRIPRIGGDCHLEPDLLDWLRETVPLKSRPKATLLLGHHNCFSAFPETVYPKPAQQLAEFFRGQEVVWLWGHEHRLGVYEGLETAEGMRVHGRCVGHGGMPIDVVEPDLSGPKLIFHDPRSHPLGDGTSVGENGWVELRLEGESLVLEYRDVDDASLFTEEFKPGAGGKLLHTYQIMKPMPPP